MIHRVTGVEVTDYTDLDNPTFHMWEERNISYKEQNGILRVFIAPLEIVDE